MTPSTPSAGHRRSRVAAAIIALLVGITTAEVTLRVLRYRSPLLRAMLHAPGDPIPFERIDSLRVLLDSAPFHLQPFQRWGGYKVNSLGFRTHEYTRASPPGTYRIVALGDSFTSDSGFVPLDHMWHSLVGTRVGERTGRVVEVINLGVPGVGPRFVLRLFELEGAALRPDLVLLGLFVGNDLFDEAPPHRRPTLGGSFLTWRFLRRATILARTPGSVVRQDEVGPGGHPIPGYVYDPDKPFGPWEKLVKVERARLLVFAVPPDTSLEERLVDLVGTVSRLDRAVREVGGRLVVALIPDRLQVDPQLRHAALEGGSLPASAYEFAWLSAELARRLDAAGVTSIDLLPAFQAAPASPPLYRRNDTHWSAAGNILAAEAIAALLARLP